MARRTLARLSPSRVPQNSGCAFVCSPHWATRRSSSCSKSSCWFSIPPSQCFACRSISLCPCSCVNPSSRNRPPASARASFTCGFSAGISAGSVNG